MISKVSLASNSQYSNTQPQNNTSFTSAEDRLLAFNRRLKIRGVVGSLGIQTAGLAAFCWGGYNIYKSVNFSSFSNALKSTENFNNTQWGLLGASLFLFLTLFFGGKHIRRKVLEKAGEIAERIPGALRDRRNITHVG